MFAVFSTVKSQAREIYRRDRKYLWRLFFYRDCTLSDQKHSIRIMRRSAAPFHKLLDAALDLLYIPLGFGITHMLIHEEHYDHMKADGLFRFYRNPKLCCAVYCLLPVPPGWLKPEFLLWRKLYCILYHTSH